MAISGREVIHGTGITSGDIVAEAVAQAAQHGSSSSATPMPGQPTRFLTLTYHHPGNEDGNSVSGTTGIPIPNSTIAEGTVWMLELQVRAVSGLEIYTYRTPDKKAFVGRQTGQAAGAILLVDVGANHPQIPDIDLTNAIALNTSGYSTDNWMYFSGLTVVSNAINAVFFGMSTNTPTDWIINVQLTPIAP